MIKPDFTSIVKAAIKVLVVFSAERVKVRAGLLNPHEVIVCQNLQHVRESEKNKALRKLISNTMQPCIKAPHLIPKEIAPKKPIPFFIIVEMHGWGSQ